MPTGGRATAGDVQGFAAGTAAHSLPSVPTLRRRRRFFRHLLLFVAGNLVLVAVWLVLGLTGDSWFFWPVFVLAGWGLLLDVHAWWAYGPRSTRRTVDR